MKKYLVLILLLPMLLFGCQNEDLMTLPRSYGNGRTHAVDVNDIQTALDEKRDMVLYIGSEMCQTCIEFKDDLNTLVLEKDLLVHIIEDIKAFPPENEYIPYDVVPTLVFIHEGEIIKKIDYNSHKDVFTDYDSLIRYINKHFS